MLAGLTYLTLIFFFWADQILSTHYTMSAPLYPIFSQTFARRAMPICHPLLNVSYCVS